VRFPLVLECAPAKKRTNALHVSFQRVIALAKIKQGSLLFVEEASNAFDNLGKVVL
jgi:hypothetical protein